MQRLNAKVALVSDASRGIGAAIDEAFVREGASVIVIDIDETPGGASAARLGAAWLPLDVRDEAAWGATLADWHAVHRTNLDGVLLGCQHALRAMRRGGHAGRGGSIVNISSRPGIVGMPAAAAHAHD